ncbi:hypothetical protein [Microbacterium excoecariae]|uniref:hypothetical protein n=1 Tax=Microbacterium excoecariae TaxID=2715210 RepID=UPI001409B796|nr:hypothetical protein [Microbacterium excoecariae]NHI16838.1 hypothetical protein [Microbacterium excoecariae]
MTDHTPFTAEEFEALMPAIVDRDTTTVATFLNERIHEPGDLVFALAAFASLAATLIRPVEPVPENSVYTFDAQGPDADAGDARAAQLVTTTLNDDVETRRALLHTIVDHGTDGFVVLGSLIGVVRVAAEQRVDYMRALDAARAAEHEAARGDGAAS